MLSIKKLICFAFAFLLSIQTVATLSEASGITLYEKTGGYFVVGDEGIVYELDSSLKLIRSAVIGSYDLEAITYVEEKDALICLDERSLSLLELDASSLMIKNIYSLRLEKQKGRLYRQFESLVYVDGTFYLAASTKKKKKEFGTLFSVELDTLHMVPRTDIPLWDVSGLTFYDNFFYLISDDKDVIARYSLELDSFKTLDLPGLNQEGIAATADSRLIVVSEDGNLDEYPADIFSR